MGLAHDLAARAAEFHAEQRKRHRHGMQSLPGAIAKEWEKKQPEVFKEATAGKTEIHAWIAHPKMIGCKPTHADMVSALPKELEEMYEAEQLKIEPSATCSRSWKLRFTFFELTSKLTTEYVARDLQEEFPEQLADEPLAKRVKRHCGDEGDF
jgi:hypothetical protein